MDKKELVFKVLLESDKPLRPGDIAEKASLSKEEVDKAIKELKNEGKIESPKRCFYQAKK
ncbi:MAG: HTH domain-containing protein [Fervidobacterium sp.]|uniref:HTH domain-containing protein n=1 Tax=Fervidobacterium gondwanense DSM 13020 TaxID=1121883 RepID=A0A1M7SQZ5_FERGO|nr:HTH domain-containing protein [Fervidobacterium gondwanense]UXF00625.1 MarR family transcriptional regulator [Fervidobacterium riparium]SHN60871.1 HTH domain-containing protein [Fervidobacterium gondwanense DSM 13020]